MKEKVISILFFIFLLFFFILNVVSKDKLISESERRKLQTFPKINISNIIDGTFMENFDEYTTDQFVFRDTFRNIKANINYKIFNKLDNNGIYVINDYIFKSEYPTNIKSINNFIEKTNSLSVNFTSNNKIYYAIIPDKSYYISDNKYLNIDYDLLYEKIREIDYQYIELRDLLELNDYYKTDTHWRQENLDKVVNRLGENMGFIVNATYDKKIYKNFYGVYYGQAALNSNPDTLIYLVSDAILNSKVYYYENENTNEVYPIDNLKNIDKYDIFLDGASSYIEIINSNNKTGKELIIFRDSFASSLAPLLIDAYSKITLIDTRYISSSIYLDMIEFTDQDILFLYSTLIVNNSSTLK